MKQSTNALLDEYTNIQSGYMSLYAYRLANLCIKADPMALLGVTVDVEDLSMNIEDVALVAMGDDGYTLNVYPKNEKQILLIGKGIALEHAEFRQEMETLPLDDEQEIRYIKLTMPEVNEERKKFMNSAVETLHKECSAQLKASNAYYTGRLTLELVGASEEDVEEAKKRFEEITDMHNKSCDEATDTKNKEIDEAYQAFIEKQQHEEEEREEAEEAEGKDAMNTYKS